jgi:hypothetical protein
MFTFLNLAYLVLHKSSFHADLPFPSFGVGDIHKFFINFFATDVSRAQNVRHPWWHRISGQRHL